MHAASRNRLNSEYTQILEILVLRDGREGEGEGGREEERRRGRESREDDLKELLR